MFKNSAGSDESSAELNIIGKLITCTKVLIWKGINFYFIYNLEKMEVDEKQQVRFTRIW